MKIKYIFKSICLVGMMLVSNTINAQVISTELKVAGNCEMCEERILNAVDIKGVRAAAWSSDDQILKITYKKEKTSLEEICAELAKVGHDTEYLKAADQDYENLHHCCQFTRIPQDSIKSYPK